MKHTVVTLELAWRNGANGGLELRPKCLAIVNPILFSILRLQQQDSIIHHSLTTAFNKQESSSTQCAPSGLQSRFQLHVQSGVERHPSETWTQDHRDQSQRPAAAHISRRRRLTHHHEQTREFARRKALNAVIEIVCVKAPHLCAASKFIPNRRRSTSNSSGDVRESQVQPNPVVS